MMRSGGGEGESEGSCLGALGPRVMAGNGTPQERIASLAPSGPWEWRLRLNLRGNEAAEAVLQLGAHPKKQRRNQRQMLPRSKGGSHRFL